MCMKKCAWTHACVCTNILYLSVTVPQRILTKRAKLTKQKGKTGNFMGAGYFFLISHQKLLLAIYCISYICWLTINLLKTNARTSKIDIMNTFCHVTRPNYVICSTFRTPLSSRVVGTPEVPIFTDVHFFFKFSSRTILFVSLNREEWSTVRFLKT